MSLYILSPQNKSTSNKEYVPFVMFIYYLKRNLFIDFDK